MKYFGTKLPPKCQQGGCYQSDNGKYFYCTNDACHKDRIRETKYNRKRAKLVYFYCPKCKSRNVRMHVVGNNYECGDCLYTWRR